MESWGPHDGISALIRRGRETRALSLSSMWLLASREEGRHQVTDQVAS